MHLSRRAPWSARIGSLQRCTACMHREICLAKTTNCFQLLDVLAKHPYRAAWARSLALYGSDQDSEPAGSGWYIPLGRLLAPKLFTNCEEISLGCTVLSIQYLSKIVVPLLSRHASVVSLDLRAATVYGSDLPLPVDSIARLLRAMPWLRSLRLPYLRPPFPAYWGIKIKGAKRSWLCCPNLTYLYTVSMRMDIALTLLLAVRWSDR
ncbi:hypothetical protein PYCCODRAFT_696492 [Trametes coccinea BRFM310]|uniref:F-box domain-containing protein n=1 Tax=Trametes coccinea (strain BRFM310) TaxID=1353009 RepID=A0A1Y2IGL6_TRAC3|nr:hypothetical protein PYCCODRAFT_696492 [Trametes coccinea BRFM310]